LTTTTQTSASRQRPPLTCDLSEGQACRSLVWGLRKPRTD
jgi:hypothetical protein